MTDEKTVSSGSDTGGGRAEMGLSIDMLDADRLRQWAGNLSDYGPDVSAWGDREWVAAKLRDMATRIEQVVKDIGKLRAAPPVGDQGVSEAPEPLSGALQDRIHRDSGAVRAAKSVRVGDQGVRPELEQARDALMGAHGFAAHDNLRIETAWRILDKLTAASQGGETPLRELVEREREFVKSVVGHWFIQGGHAQFGDIGAPQNADELISMILQAVRAASSVGERAPEGACEACRGTQVVPVWDSARRDDWHQQTCPVCQPHAAIPAALGAPERALRALVELELWREWARTTFYDTRDGVNWTDEELRRNCEIAYHEK